MESVMNLRVVIDHPQPAGTAKAVAKAVEEDLTNRLFRDMRPVKVTVTVQSAVMEMDGAMEITPSSELLRAIGL